MILNKNIIQQLLDEIHQQIHEFPEATTLEIDPEFWRSIERYLLKLPGQPLLWQTIDDYNVKLYEGKKIVLKEMALDLV